MSKNPENELSKRLAEVVTLEAEETKQVGGVGYMARTMVQATLPHKATAGNMFTRTNGNLKLRILSPDGLPYGSIPRLLLSWLTTEAVRTKSPRLVLGSSLSAFTHALDLWRSGGKNGDITRLKMQTKRLFMSTISCTYDNEHMSAGKNLTITDDYMLWWDGPSPHQKSLWDSTVTLSQNFFEELIQRPVPIDMLALKTLKRSPMALDIYFWLTYRMSYLKKDTVIPWELLQMQFGADYAQTPEGLRGFKKKFLLRLKSVVSIYDRARVDNVDNGLLLRPSSPHIPKVPIPPNFGKPKGHLPTQIDMFATENGIFTPQITLRPSTLERVKKLAVDARLDLYELERQWKDWMLETGKRPKNPDGAFVGWVKKKIAQHNR